MLVELVLGGGILIGVLGALDGIRGRRPGSPREFPAEAAIREAMRGEEGATVRAEFRRRGTSPPERPRGYGFLWESR